MLVVGCAVAAPATTVALAASGALDRSFGDGGIARVKDAAFNAMAVQANGRIVTAGSTDGRHFALTRLLSNGRLDRSFGGDGRVSTLMKPAQCVGVNAVAIAAGAKIVAAGSPSCASGAFALVRYRSDGRLDTSFGHGGKVVTRFGGARCVAHPYALAVQRDRRIVAGGVALCHGTGGHFEFALARYQPNGKLDTSFGGDGRVTTRFSTDLDYVRELLIQSDGKIVAVGSVGVDTDAAQFALARYNRNGTLDKSFGGDGRVTSDFTGEPGCSTAEADAAAIQKNGRIVVGGFAGCGTVNFALARYKRDGSLDSTFAGNGRVVTLFDPDDCSDRVRGVAIQPDRKIVAVGVAGCRNPRIGFAVARYGANGTLDRTFGGDGKVTTIIGPSSKCFSQFEAVALRSDGRIIGGGFSSCGSNSETGVVVRYLGR